MGRLRTTADMRVKTVQQDLRAPVASAPHVKQAQSQNHRHCPPRASPVLQMRRVPMGRAECVRLVLLRLPTTYLVRLAPLVRCAAAPKPPVNAPPATQERSPTVRRATASTVRLVRQATTAPAQHVPPVQRAEALLTPMHANRAPVIRTRPTGLHVCSAPQVRLQPMIM